jgi:trimeric autotransporter adhesin
MFNLIADMRKLSVIFLYIIIAVFLFSLVACESSSRLSVTPPEITTSSPTKLVFLRQPSWGISGLAFDTQPVVTVEDTAGNMVPNYQGPIELTITAGTGNSEARIFGGTKILTTNSTVEFKSLSIDKAGVGYTLTASSGNLIPATSAPFTISHGKPAKLVFSVQPSNGTAGVSLTANPEVTVQDIYENAVTDFKGSVTISAMGYYDDYSDQSQQPIIRKYPVTLSGTTTENLVNGAARFSDVSIQFKVASRYTLTAMSDSLESATSGYFSISAGAPAKLEFTVQPSGGEPGNPFENQPTVAIEDKYGNVVNSSRESITVSLTPGSGTTDAILSGITTLIAEDAFGGVGSFMDLSIDRPGIGYTLTATVSGLPSVKSQAFDVLAT